MKLNRVQKIITVVAIVLFVLIWLSYYYTFRFSPVEWFTYKKPPLEKVSQCTRERESRRITKNLESEEKRVGRIDWEAWELKPERDQEVCNPPQLNIISMRKVPIQLRQRTIQDVLFTYFTIGIITGLLLFLTKDIKRE